jgi:hypothetical protein
MSDDPFYYEQDKEHIQLGNSKITEKLKMQSADTRVTIPISMTIITPTPYLTRLQTQEQIPPNRMSNSSPKYAY